MLVLDSLCVFDRRSDATHTLTSYYGLRCTVYTNNYGNTKLYFV